MIKLTKVVLINFQKHKKLTVDFNDNVNVITGLSNKGKSCIRRAIDWVIFCLSITEKDLRKEGSKITQVILSFNNGVVIEKVRSVSINRYILRKPNTKEQTFDSFGKEAPEEVRNAIGMSAIEVEKESLNLNIAEQLTLPFLLDKPPSFRAKLFNKLTGNELIDSLFKKCNRESLRIGRDLKTTEELIIKQENDVVEYSERYSKDKKKLVSVQERFTSLKKKSDTVDQLKTLSIDLESNTKNVKCTNDELSKIKIVDEKTIKELRKKADNHSLYSEVYSKLLTINKAIKELSLVKIPVPTVNFADLRRSVEKFESLKDTSKRIEKNIEDERIVNLNIKNNDEYKTTNEKELKELWEKCDTCPLCKGKIKHVA